MNAKKKAAAAAVLILAAALFLFISHSGYYLVLYNAKTGEEYGAFALSQDKSFSVQFIHSVNQTPVVDRYEIRDGSFVVVETIYYGFGAGVQTELNEGETLTYGDDGSMIISGIDKTIDSLLYIVGTVSDHILTIDDEEISLRDLCGRNTLVRFSYEWRFCFY